jgi:DNA mismatch endonuclease (patch repair protein)
MGHLLRQNGIRGYRKHWRVDGKPDFAWPRLKVALFVDGCFWHGCPRCDRPAKSNVVFWRTKVQKNRLRDKLVGRSLKRNGWKVLRIWECRVQSEFTIKRIRIAIEERKGRAAEPQN